MIRATKPVGAVLLLLLVGPVATSKAQDQLAYTAIEGVDLTKASYAMNRLWRPGVLRVRLHGLPADHWTIRLDYGNGVIIVLDSAGLAARQVAADPDGITVDIPTVPGSTIRATASVATIRVVPIEAIQSSTIHPEQLLPNSTVVNLTDMPPSEAAAAAGFARAEMLTANNTPIGYCTAFRVSDGYWLTAAHCFYRTKDHPEQPPVARLRIQPDDYASQAETAAPFLGVVVASGLLVGNAPTAVIQDQDLDYALVRADTDPGGYVFSLSHPGSMAPNKPLVLFQHWSGSSTPPFAGKSKAEGGSCAILERLGPNDRSRPDLCPEMLQHGCSSGEGASGSPLVQEGSYALVGLHYGAGLSRRLNCAIPVTTVTYDLCHRYPSIAGKVTQCH